MCYMKVGGDGPGISNLDSSSKAQIIIMPVKISAYVVVQLAFDWNSLSSVRPESSGK